MNNESGLQRGEEKYTLLTNLHFVQHGNLRTFCRALLLSEGSIGLTEPIWSVRGFGTEAAWEVFNMWLSKDAFPYTLTPFEDRGHLFILEDGTTRPIFQGNTLRFKDGTTFVLQAGDSSSPIDVHVQHGDICSVWRLLAEKAIEYWDAPYIPHLEYLSAHGVRALQIGRQALVESSKIK